MSHVNVVTESIIRRLPRPGRELTPQYLDQLVAALESAIDTLNSTRQRNFTEINLSNTQTHGGNLRVGDVFTDDGILTIIQAHIAYPAPLSATGSVGTVTVSTP